MANRHVNETHPEVVKRLRRAVGQLNSIIAMIEEGRGCTDIAMQLQAAEKALTQAKKTFIHEHIDHCLDDGLVSASKATLAEFREMSKYL